MAPKVPLKWIIAGGALYVCSASGVYLYLRSTKGSPTPCVCSNDGPKGDGDVFDRIAGIYDSNIDLDETLMGIKLLRRSLIRNHASGKVLEVSAGTARNLPYYNWDNQVSSLTLTDSSPEMLKAAYEKVRSDSREHTVRLCLADAQDLCSNTQNNPKNQSKSSKDNISSNARDPSNSNGSRVSGFGPALDGMHKFEAGSFDTVLDSFGLCSHDDPVKVLKEMAKVVAPGGKLLLLQHGRSSWDFINRILDQEAEPHKAKWGCSWNRDILGLVKEAGLEVESVQRWHFGTTYVIVARGEQQPNACVI